MLCLVFSFSKLGWEWEIDGKLMSPNDITNETLQIVTNKITDLFTFSYEFF